MHWHCLKIRALWSSLLTALDIAWVTPLLTKDVIISCNKIPLRKDDRKILRATLCCLFWAIWKERNKVVFKDEQFSLSKLKFFFVYSLCSWARLGICDDSLIIRKLVHLARP